MKTRHVRLVGGRSSAVKITIPQNTLLRLKATCCSPQTVSPLAKNCRSVKNEFLCAFTIPTLISVLSLLFVLFLGLL